MTDFAYWPWVIVVIAATIILGAAIAWGMVRAGQRTNAEKRLNERGAHELYEREEDRVR